MTAVIASSFSSMKVRIREATSLVSSRFQLLRYRVVGNLPDNPLTTMEPVVSDSLTVIFLGAGCAASNALTAASSCALVMLLVSIGMVYLCLPIRFADRVTIMTPGSGFVNSEPGG